MKVLRFISSNQLKVIQNKLMKWVRNELKRSSTGCKSQMILHPLCLPLPFLQHSECLPGDMNLHLVRCKMRKRTMEMCTQYAKLQYLRIRRKAKTLAGTKWFPITENFPYNLRYHSNHAESRFNRDVFQTPCGSSDFRDNFLALSGVLLASLPISSVCDRFLSCLNALPVLPVISIFVAIWHLHFPRAGSPGQKDGLSQPSWLLKPDFKDDWMH